MTSSPFMLPQFGRSLFDLVLPPRCPGCGGIVAGDGLFCTDCWRQLRFIGQPACAGCGVPFEIETEPTACCATCLTHPPAFDGARAVLAYDDIPRSVLMRFKHGDRPHHGRMMAGQMARIAGDWLVDDQALLIPVPLARWRLWRRSYNQAVVLGRQLRRLTGTPLALDALLRVRETASSGHAGPAARRRNVRGAFALSAAGRGLVAGRRIVLIDDVMTTGATADACATTLKRGGAASVRVLVWARALKD